MKPLHHFYSTIGVRPSAVPEQPSNATMMDRPRATGSSKEAFHSQ